MRISTPLEADILRSHVNFFLGTMFLGSFTLGAALMIWHAATDKNPVADAIAQTVYAQKVELGQI